jgi:hypothetical protein
MEMNVFQALGHVLGLYANIAIAWMMAVVADLVINKPMGWSPAGHRVQARAPVRHQPGGRRRDGHRLAAVGGGAPGRLGPMAQAFSALIALVTAFVASPLIAWATKGALLPRAARSRSCGAAGTRQPTAATAACSLLHLRARLRSRGHGACARPTRARSARCAARWTRAATTCASPTRGCRRNGARAAPLLPRRMWPQLDAGLAHYLLLMALLAPAWRCCWPWSTRRPRACAGRAGARAGADAARRLRRRLPAAADRGRHRRLVAGAGAAEPAGGAGRVEPPDRGAVARDRVAPPHRRGSCRPAKHE